MAGWPWSIFTESGSTMIASPYFIRIASWLLVARSFFP
jgi:hypothetical protein